MSPARPPGSHMFLIAPWIGQHKPDASSFLQVSLSPLSPLQRQTVHRCTRRSTHRRHTPVLQCHHSHLHLPLIASSDFRTLLFLRPHQACLGSTPSLFPPHCERRLICLLCPVRAPRRLTRARLLPLRLERLLRLYSHPRHCHDSCLCRLLSNHLAMTSSLCVLARLCAC